MDMMDASVEPFPAKLCGVPHLLWLWFSKCDAVADLLPVFDNIVLKAFSM